MPLAAFHDLRQGLVRIDYDQSKKILMTVGTDRTIKVSSPVDPQRFVQSHPLRSGTCHPLYQNQVSTDISILT